MTSCPILTCFWSKLSKKCDFLSHLSSFFHTICSVVRSIKNTCLKIGPQLVRSQRTNWYLLKDSNLHFRGRPSVLVPKTYVLVC